MHDFGEQVLKQQKEVVYVGDRQFGYRIEVVGHA